CCEPNIKVQWPKERGFRFALYKKNYIFYANPAPMFPMHFTMVSEKHRPMEMDVALVSKMMDKLPGLWIGQNGPKAGASNPWHFHIQVMKTEFPASKTKAKTTYEKVFSDKERLIIEELALPMPVYRFRFQKLTPKIIAFITSLKDKYLKMDPKNQITMAGTKRIDEKGNAGFELYLTLKNTDYKAKEYKIGYPEPLGFFCTPYKKRLGPWLQNGEKKYYEVFEKVRISDGLHDKFKENLRNLDLKSPLSAIDGRGPTK
ncbi:DUF4922 domain-containing protein, partial [Candidatus Margulisiibacteriota bacterium]